MKKTVIFYKDSIKIVEGDYEHKGSEPFLIDPVLPIGISKSYWKYGGDRILTMNKDEKIKASQIQSNIPHLVHSNHEDIQKLKNKIKGLEERCIAFSILMFIAITCVLILTRK